MSTNPFLTQGVGGAGPHSPPAQSSQPTSPGSPAARHSGDYGASSAATQRYQPTTVPTPGRPLLRNGQTLVYPSGWTGCRQCQDTGYKHGDPSHPCKKCWSSYSQRYNPILASSFGLAGSKVMQRPLPRWDTPGIGGPAQAPGGGPMPLGRHGTGMSGYPGAGPSYRPNYGSPAPPMHPQTTGNSFYAGPHAPPPMGPLQGHGSLHAVPHQGGPPRLPRRPSPPAVARAEEAREETNDDEGEAPPAYADVIKSGPDGVLPPQQPQRTGASAQPSSSSTASPQSPSSFHSPQQQSHSPQQHPFVYDQQHQQHPSHARPPPNQNHPYQYPHQPPGGYPSGSGNGHYYTGQAPMRPHFVGGPPPGAMVVHPGDPRIGGRLCHKCGGAGVRDTLFLFQETCYHCNGLGRIL